MCGISPESIIVLFPAFWLGTSEQVRESFRDTRYNLCKRPSLVKRFLGTVHDTSRKKR